MIKIWQGGFMFMSFFLWFLKFWEKENVNMDYFVFLQKKLCRDESHAFLSYVADYDVETN